MAECDSFDKYDAGICAVLESVHEVRCWLDEPLVCLSQPYSTKNLGTRFENWQRNVIVLLAFM